MKQLKNIIYEQLSPKERIIASIEAQARNDENEMKRLINTCPTKHYTSTDKNYSYRMERLSLIQISMEYDLMSCVLNYLLILHSELETEKMMFAKDKALQSFSDIHTAFQEFLNENGISTQSMNKIIEEMRHPYLKIIFDIVPEPNPKGIRSHKELLNQIYNKNL